MKKLRAVIAEDEPLMRAHLRALAENLPRPLEIVAEATDGAEAVMLVEKHQPDLLLLDVQMPVLDGFAVLEKLLLGGAPLPEVIFATAYDRYALKAFELNAVHYLLKPISAERLAAAVDRAAERIAARHPPEQQADRLAPYEEDLRRLLQNLGPAAGAAARPAPLAGLTAKARDQLLVIPLDEVFHISAESGLNFIHTRDQRHLTDFTLDELEKRLDPARFLRIHRAHLVNLGHVKALVPWTEGRFEVVLNDPAGTRLGLSRYRLPEMRARLLW